MKLLQWYAQRDPAYIRQRAVALRERYGITPVKAIRRVTNCVALLAEYGCAPTFPTPGRVVERHPDWIRLLQERGAEIAVHGFDHVDLCAYPLEKGRQQLVRATAAFDRHGIEWRGFRCPYLGCPEDLPALLPPGLFDYSSNRAIEWDASLPDGDGVKNQAVHEVLQRVYRPLSSRDAVSVPWSRAHIIEIPVTLPDDLTLHDGHQLGSEGLAEVWIRVLRATHERGEMFVLMYHPELGEPCQRAFAAVLDEAARLRPGVWLARLRDISGWWREKDAFDASISSADASLNVSFACSDRATILVKGLATAGSEPWDDVYRQLRARSLQVPAEPRPFLGLPANAPPHRVTFLREQGYILDMGETAPRCATYLDATVLDRMASDVDLISLIEASPGPLIRYWRWPDGARSVLSITGDLDAVSLLDYTTRLFVR